MGLVDVYNLLPVGIVETKDVHTIQAALQALMKLQIPGDSRWGVIYSQRLSLHNHLVRPHARSVQCEWQGGRSYRGRM